ncbi:MAG: hypothetical protein H6600_07080 [Flavobacteriales bacterium]|nr:hypothetical protein [Flavobacteriales bacterium]
MKVIILLLPVLLLSSCDETAEPTNPPKEHEVLLETTKQETTFVPLDNIDYSGSDNYSDTIYPIAYPEFKWNGLELLMTNEYYIHIDHLINDYNLSNSFLLSDDYYKDFHVVDLNHDLVEEIIYYGYTNGEPHAFAIFYLSDGKYKMYKEFQQYIRSIETLPNGKIKLVMSDPGCCASYDMSESHYLISDWETDPEEYVKILYTDTDRPLGYFEEPINFMLNTTANYLRSSPIKNDSTGYAPWNEELGNRIATFHKGDLGRAFAKSTDNEGREWWFVEIYPNQEFDFSMLSYRWIENISYIGWMSNKHLLITDNQK